MNPHIAFTLSFKRVLFMVATLGVALSASAQYYYPQPQAYPYGYQYSAPQYPQYQQPYQQQYPQYYEQQQPVRKAPYDKIPYPNGEADSSKPIEIWLGKQVGRWGDYWFPALGGKSSHRTPQGKFTVKARHKEFYSRKYESKMPRSVFFTEQCAIHVGSLKTKSHGCIHVDWEAGELIYDLSKTGKTKVIVHP